MRFDSCSGFVFNEWLDTKERPVKGVVYGPLSSVLANL